MYSQSHETKHEIYTYKNGKKARNIYIYKNGKKTRNIYIYILLSYFKKSSGKKSKSGEKGYMQFASHQLSRPALEQF